MANIVESVQVFSLSTTGTSVSGTLAGGTDHTQCMPFVMATAGTTLDNYQDSQAGVAMSSGNVTVTREDSTGTLLAEVMVVEFKDVVTVQQGTYTIADATSSTTEAITAVTLADAWPIAYGIATTATNQDRNSVRVHFNSDSELGFNRSSTSTEKTGQWYVAEHPSFNTQEFEAVSMTGTSITSTPSSYNSSRSFVVADTAYSAAVRSPDNAGVYVTMTDSTTITYNRVSGLGNHTIDAFLVSCSAGEFRSQSGTHDMDNQGTSDTVTVTAVDLDRTAAFAAIRSPGGSATDGTNANAPKAVTRMELTAATTLTIYKAEATTAGTANVGWYVVDWALDDPVAGMMGCNF